MNRATKYALTVCALWALLAFVALSRTAPAQQPDQQTHHAAKSHPPAPAATSDGERVFQQNCSRCHNAPQSFSPRISYAVIRHMRVRASLSAADEKALLKFMNP
jgi:cytochrome c5